MLFITHFNYDYNESATVAASELEVLYQICAVFDFDTINQDLIYGRVPKNDESVDSILETIELAYEGEDWKGLAVYKLYPEAQRIERCGERELIAEALQQQ